MTQDLRCEGGKKFAVLVKPGVIEVKCDSVRCRRPGVVTLHRISTTTAEVLETLRFQDPVRGGTGVPE